MFIRLPIVECVDEDDWRILEHSIDDESVYHRWFGEEERDGVLITNYITVNVDDIKFICPTNISTLTEVALLNKDNLILVNIAENELNNRMTYAGILII